MIWVYICFNVQPSMNIIDWVHAMGYHSSIDQTLEGQSCVLVNNDIATPTKHGWVILHVHMGICTVCQSVM